MKQVDKGVDDVELNDFYDSSCRKDYNVYRTFSQY